MQREVREGAERDAARQRPGSALAEAVGDEHRVAALLEARRHVTPGQTGRQRFLVAADSNHQVVILVASRATCHGATAQPISTRTDDDSGRKSSPPRIGDSAARAARRGRVAVAARPVHRPVRAAVGFARVRFRSCGHSTQ